MADVAMPDATAARAYSLLHLDETVLDTVIDGTLLAATDTSSPVDVPMTIVAAGLGAGVHRRRTRRGWRTRTRPSRWCGSRARATRSTTSARPASTYLAHVEGFITARAAAARS